MEVINIKATIHTLVDIMRMGESESDDELYVSEEDNLDSDDDFLEDAINDVNTVIGGSSVGRELTATSLVTTRFAAQATLDSAFQVTPTQVTSAQATTPQPNVNLHDQLESEK